LAAPVYSWGVMSEPPHCLHMLHHEAAGRACRRARMVLADFAKMVSGVNAFEISKFHEEETEVALIKRSECNNVTLR